MKMTIRIGFAALLLFLAISCKKESSTIQSSGINSESLSQNVLKDASALAGNTVRIGSQVWMTKNLDVSRYKNGDRIPQVRSGAKWAALTIGAWCWYNNDSTNGAVYGKLYNWYAVNDPRGLAPEGWHIPSDPEWATLSAFLGGDEVAGGKMKETGTIHWAAPNADASNSSGFTGLPGGGRYNGIFANLTGGGIWWSSTEYDTLNVWYRYLGYGWGNLGRLSDEGKQEGFSVRCLRDY